MSLWNRATDVTSLRKLVRYAIVGAMAVLLTVQVVGTARAVPIPCTTQCAVGALVCSNLANAGRNADIALCDADEANCELFDCVLSGYTFGSGFAKCRAGCLAIEASCEATAQANYLVEINNCNFNNAVCLLFCKFCGCAIVF